MRDELYPTDMSKLDRLLTEQGISHELRKHPSNSAGVKDLLGYSLAGDWQILIKRPEGVYSVIRGMASFGSYEIMGVDGDAKWSDDPARFETPTELVEALKESDHGNPKSVRKENTE